MNNRTWRPKAVADAFALELRATVIFLASPIGGRSGDRALVAAKILPQPIARPGQHRTPYRLTSAVPHSLHQSHTSFRSRFTTLLVAQHVAGWPPLLTVIQTDPFPHATNSLPPPSRHHRQSNCRGRSHAAAEYLQAIMDKRGWGQNGSFLVCDPSLRRRGFVVFSPPLSIVNVSPSLTLLVLSLGHR
jgi:hypothetical protein